MIRIKDIAEIAGVSPTTVSNVIHGNTKKVSPETIEKINRLLEENHYVPSLGARMLAGSRSRIIGVIVGLGVDRNKRRLSDTFTGEILSAMESCISSRGYYTIFHQTGQGDPLLELIAGWSVEGIITLGIGAEENLAIKKAAGLPIVSIDVYYDDEKLVNVGLDDYGGGYSMAEYLQRKGRKNLLFLSSNDIGVDHFRWRGVKQALSEAGIEDAQSRHLVFPAFKDERMAYYEEKMDYLMSFDALFFASDYYAMEAMAFLQKKGYRIPENIAVAGFDDSYLADLAYPGLTTVRQDVSGKGTMAAECLFRMIQGEELEETDIRLKTELVIRDSV